MLPLIVIFPREHSVILVRHLSNYVVLVKLFEKLGNKIKMKRSQASDGYVSVYEFDFEI